MKFKSGDNVASRIHPNGLRGTINGTGYNPYIFEDDYAIQWAGFMQSIYSGFGVELFDHLNVIHVPEEEKKVEYTRQEDLERLMDSLGMSKHARPISPADVYEMALEEVRKLKERDAAVNEPLRQAAIKMQVAVGNVLMYGGTEPDKWFDAIADCQRNLAAQTKGCRAEFETYYAEVGRHEVFKE